MVQEVEQRRSRSTIAILMSFVLALAAMVPFAATAGAQDEEATPVDEAGLELDLPQIAITAEEATYTLVVPGENPPGDWEVNFTNATDGPAGVNFALLDEEQSPGDFSAALHSVYMQGEELPEWWEDTTFAGGAYADAGETTDIVVSLTPGTWVIFNSYPGGDQALQTLSVLSEEELAGEEEADATPEATPEAMIPADHQASISDDAIDFPAAESGLWEVTNDSSAVNDMIVVAAEGDVDDAAADEMAEAFAAGEDIDGTIVGGVGALSPGAVTYVSLDVDEAGTLVVFSSQPGGVEAAEVVD